MAIHTTGRNVKLSVQTKFLFFYKLLEVRGSLSWTSIPWPNHRLWESCHRNSGKLICNTRACICGLEYLYGTVYQCVGFELWSKSATHIRTHGIQRCELRAESLILADHFIVTYTDFPVVACTDLECVISVLGLIIRLVRRKISLSLSITDLVVSFLDQLLTIRWPRFPGPFRRQKTFWANRR